MNDHAERLRKMAAGRLQSARDEEQLNAGLNLHSGAMIATKQSIAHYRAQAAALLAGAEALEAVEAYRRYDAFGRDNSAWVGPEAKNSAETSKRLWAEFRAALARLEGK